jgi:SAM-dependent methyltransferase
MDARIKNEVLKWRDELLEREYAIVEEAQKALGREGYRLIDIGCGPFGLLGRKPGRLGVLVDGSIGIDIDQASLAKNTNVRHLVCGTCYTLPLASDSVDFVICRWVFEHLEHPEEAMGEFARVLRKGGFLYIKTPNWWNYTMLLSWATPTVFHNVVRSAIGLRENSSTFYRANTRRRLRELAGKCSFKVRQLESHSNSFMYYSFNKELFLVMRALSTLAGKITDGAQQTLFCMLEKV